MLVRDEGGESGVSAVLPVMNYSQGTCGGMGLVGKGCQQDICLYSQGFAALE